MYDRDANRELVEALVELMHEIDFEPFPEAGARKACLSHAKNAVLEAGLEMGWGRQRHAKRHYDRALQHICYAYRPVE